MKNNKRNINLTGFIYSLMLMLFLSACADDAPVTESVQRQEDVVETDTAEEIEWDDTVEDTSSDEEAGDEVGDRPEGEMEIEESILTQQEAEELIMPLTQWAGLYLTGMLDQSAELDDTLKMQIAGVTVAYGFMPEISSETVTAEDVDGIWFADPEGYLYASPDKVLAAAGYLFEDPIERDGEILIQNPEETESICLFDEEGGVLVRDVDWGTENIQGSIASIENMGGILNQVTVSYVLYNSSEDANTQELGIIEYYVQGTAESGAAPKIIDMHIETLYFDPAAYLPENWSDHAIEWTGENYSLKLPDVWENRFYVYQEDHCDFFICSASVEENYTGMLFSIAGIPTGEPIEDPSYQILGEKDGIVYIAVFPTDVQFDPDNSYSTGEYTDMSRYIDGILSTVSFDVP